MTIEQFIPIFADLLDDTDVSEIKADTYFQELDEWSSLLNLGVIALVKTSFGKDITVKEIHSCETVQDLFNYIQQK